MMKRINKHKTALTVSAGLFLIITILSSMVGGLLQFFLILAAFILLLGIFIGGTVIFGWEKFWWGHFKPTAAIPIAWGLFHLAFVFMLPDVPGKLWTLHWKLIIVIEISAFVLCMLLNKRTTFEERTSRKLLSAHYVYFFIAAGIMIICRLFFGEFAANLNRTVLSKLVNSKVELVAEDTERLIKAYRAKPALEKLDELRQKAKKLGRLDKKEKKEFFSEFKKMEARKAEVRKEYAVPEDKKINWREWWPFGKSAEARIEPSLAGTFGMPAAAIQNPDGSWNVVVPADQLEVGFTIQGKKGQIVTITATGQVNGCKNRYDAAFGWTGPEGRKWDFDKRRKRPLGPGSLFMALGAKVEENGEWFYVGEKVKFRLPRDMKKIYLGVNDDTHDRHGRFRPDWYKDNEGKFIAKVEII